MEDGNWDPQVSDWSWAEIVLGLGGGGVGIHPNGMGPLGVWGLLPAQWGPR